MREQSQSSSARTDGEIRAHVLDLLDGRTLLRQALLVSEHNVYHLGGLVAVRQALSA